MLEPADASGALPPRRLAAIVAIDMVGYARLVGEDEAGTLRRLKSLRRALIDPRLAQGGGRIVKTTGDGLLVEFASVQAAVAAAADVQRALADRQGEAAPAMAFRIGIHLGDVVVDGDDLMGDGINVAARLEGVAPAGGIALSEAVHASIAGRIDLDFTDLGTVPLKNIRHAVRVYAWTPDARSPARTRRRAMSWRGVLVAAAVLGLAGGVALVPTDFGWREQAPVEMADVPATPARASVAVLPLLNLSDTPDEDYFAAGLTEDLMAALGRFRELTVVGRNTAFRYLGDDGAVGENGRTLGIAYLVEGSVRRSEDRVLVTARLLEAETGRVLWSDRYDDAGDNVFAVQEAIARNVAGRLAVTVTQVEQDRALEAPTESLDAYDLVLRARHLMLRGTRADNREARALLERATTLDPDYAAAHAWSGQAYVEMAELGWTEDPDWAIRRATDAAQRALAREPNGVKALSVAAQVQAFRGHYEDALAATDQILEINPSDADGLHARAGLLLWLGRIDEAIVAGERALRYDPEPRQEPIFNLGLAYYTAGRYAEATRVLRQGLARFPDNAFFNAVLAAALARAERLPEAQAALAEVRRANPFFDPNRFGSKFRDPEHRANLREGLREAAAES